MAMRNFKNLSDGLTYSFDAATQQHLIDECLADTDTWTEVSSQPQTPTLADLQTIAVKRIDQAHAQFLLKAVGNPTQVEINTWPLKLEIKNAILAELPLNQEQQAFVDSAGLDTPAKQTAWAQSVQAKSAYSAHATGVAEAVRDTAKEMVQAAQTAEELAEVMQQLTALAEQKLAEVLAVKG